MFELLIFLFSNNFYYLTYIVCVLLLLLVIVRDKFLLRRYKSKSLLVLILASIFYCLVYSINKGVPSTSMVINLFVSPVILYYVGLWRGGNFGVDYLRRDMFIIFFATATHGILNVITNYGIDILNISGRQYTDIYGNQTAATLQNLYFVVPTGFLFYFLIVYKGMLLKKLVGITFGLSGIFCSVINASRTMIIVSAIVFLVALLLYLIQNNKTDIAIVKYLCWLLALLIILLVIYNFNLFNWQTKFAQTALGQRTALLQNGIGNNSRWDYATEILSLLPNYSMGNVPSTHYAHNLWIDIAKDAGVIPFVLFILFSFSNCHQCYRFLKNRIVSDEEKLFILPVIASFFLVFFTEPIMQGLPYIFALFCFVMGVIESMNILEVKTWKEC